MSEAGTSWIDADWRRGGRAAAAIVLEDGRLLLPDGSTLEVRDDESAEDVAIAVLAALAARAAAAARHSGGPAAVNGCGLVARFTRILIGTDESSDRPAVVVDTIGSADALAAATQRVADLGAVVLVAPTEPSVSLDLYPDVHLRGLTLVGIPLLEDGAAPAAPDTLAGLARRSLATALEAEPGALWYRLSAGAPAESNGETPPHR